ncbi:FMR1 neighbor protein isoform X2 [Manis javanica]|uniref:FMR1 neighbor protein isoform X2 n=1 Tax=Manis javanica TaxID=9974 RepID=UPI003C6D81DB
MPSDRKLWNAQAEVHSRQMNPEVIGSAEQPSPRPHVGRKGPRRQAMGAAARHRLRALARRRLSRMSARRRRCLLVAAICISLLGYSLGPDPPPPSGYSLRRNENANGQPLDETSVRKDLSSFFFPTTCIPKGSQVVKPCKERKDLNKSDCLREKCCYSSSQTSSFRCFAPLKDEDIQMFQMFVLSVSSMIILGCLPIYCCCFCRRRRRLNPLQRKVNRNVKGLKKQRKKMQRNAKMLGTAMKDEEGLSNEGEPETTALFSY